VDCEVLADSSQEKMTYGRLPVLRREGVSIRIDHKHKTANNKIILIDDRTIITGSYNYTKAAEEQNAENLLIIKGYRGLFSKYDENYERLRADSRMYERN
jgi:phosphatidylserine/phosphatidylglycerophosphate/cardiolipin synthase-like enzyme